jgi:hypothetical protein
MNFSSTPHNRWTAYESPNTSDWVEIDWATEKQVARIELAIYDDRGGVKPPESYNVQLWDGQAWRDAQKQVKIPAKPAGGRFNEVKFERARTSKLRVVFTHAAKGKSGVSEIMIWGE